jgi:membrane protease YdiL (CAAX protease family)
MVVTAAGVGEMAGFAIQAAAFAAILAVGLAIAGRAGFGYNNVGLRRVEPGSARRALFFAPAVIAEGAALVMGLAGGLGAGAVGVLGAFALLVGLSEELFFRGLVLRCLGGYGKERAVLVGAILFGAGHAANAFVSGGLMDVLPQVMFALLFGVAAGQLTVVTGSIVPAVCWHFAHDFVAYVTNDGVGGSALVVLGVQIILMAAYAALLYKRMASDG